MIFCRSLCACILLSLAQARRLHGLERRKRYSMVNVGKVVPDPSATESQLNQLEGTIRNWPEAGKNVAALPPSETGFTSTNIPIPAVVPTSSGSTSNETTKVGQAVGDNSTSTSTVDDLSQLLANLENQSNNNIAQVTGGVASNGIMIDLIRVNMTRLASEVRRNITRLKNAIDQLGTSSSVGQDTSLRSISGKAGDLQAQVNQIQSTLSSLPDVNSRINSLGNSVQKLQSRVSALENFESESSAAALSQSAESSSSSGDSSSSTGLKSLILSWSGRAALLGIGLGLIALSLAVFTFLKIPATPKQESAAAPVDEQVLLEAGEGQEEGAVAEGGGEEEVIEGGEEEGEVAEGTEEQQQ